VRLSVLICSSDDFKNLLLTQTGIGSLNVQEANFWNGLRIARYSGRIAS
jgi:hypothetical protein